MSCIPDVFEISIAENNKAWYDDDWWNVWNQVMRVCVNSI